VKTIFGLSRHRFRASIWFLTFTGLLPRCGAQSTLSLQEAINKAVESRAGLRAEADRVSIAQGFERQSRRIANPTFQFENQNLRPGQNYSVDVDTYAYLTQPLDILGKRKQRIAVASQGVVSSQAGYDLVRRQIVEAVKHAYWDARGAQELREVLKATVENFQSIVDYHSAQFNVGAIPEQDLLRIRLENERPQIDASLAAMLYVTFNSVKQALLVVLVVGNVPFALIGGIAALWIRGMNLNLSASIGFIALFGVAMLNGVVLVSSINRLCAGIRREPIKERFPVAGAIPLDSAGCATMNSRKYWDGRATESTGRRSMKPARRCVYGCGASAVIGS